MSTVNLTAETIDETLAQDGITLVDWWADWCGPCRMFAPTFEAASEQHPDITFAKIDTEAEPQLAGQAQIRSIPTLMAFRDGILLWTQPGVMGAQQLNQLIDFIKGIDMDEVRQKVADEAAEKAAEN
jgi:thioredoxin 1